MGRKPKTPLSKIATNSSPINLNWESAKQACLDRKNLTTPPKPTEIMHDLQRWPEAEIQIQKKGSPPKATHKSLPRTLTNTQSPTQPETGAQSKSIELAKNKRNVRYKGVQRTLDKIIEKQKEQVARKTLRLATKVKNPKTFEQKYKTIDGKILTYTPNNAWVKTFAKQPRLLINRGTAFVPNPLINGPCRPSLLSDDVAYKPAWRTGPCLRFFDIENSNASQHPMFKEDTRTGLPIKLTRQEKAAQNTSQGSPTKRKINKATGKRTGRKPVRRLQTPRGMNLQTEVEEEKKISNSPEKDDEFSSTSEDIISRHQNAKHKSTHRLQLQQESRLETNRRP